jgi:hypothetical protein
MKFAKWVYAIAGVYGLLVTLPLFFSENQIGEMMPPFINHPEYYYGFAFAVLAWQVAFLVIARDPLRYRGLMPVTFLEKFPYVVGIAVLFLQGRAPQQLLWTGSIDFVLGILFVIAYWRTARQPTIETKTSVAFN